MLSTLGLPFPHTPPALTAPHTPPLPCSSMSEPTWPPPGHYAVFRSCQSDRVLISQSRPGKMSRSHRDNSCFVAAHFPRNRNLANPNLANLNPGALLATGARHPRTARAALHAAASPTTFLAKAGTRAVRNVTWPHGRTCPWRLPSHAPAPPHATRPAQARHTGNVGVMINMSTQPIGIICRIRYSTNADPRCWKAPPLPHTPHTPPLQHTDASIRLESMRPLGQ